MEKRHIFSLTEKAGFLHLLKKYSQIIENKNTDGSTLAQKRVAWNKLAREYNSSSFATKQVTTNQLKRLWSNTKLKQRDALTLERQHRMATGGGPPVADADIDPLLVSEIAPALLVAVDDVIDSDSTFIPNTIQDLEYEENSPTIPSPTRSTVQSQIFPFRPPMSIRQQVPRPQQQARQSRPNINSVINKEYVDRKERQSEIQLLQKQLLEEQIKDQKYKTEITKSSLKEQEYKTEFTRLSLTEQEYKTESTRLSLKEQEYKTEIARLLLERT